MHTACLETVCASVSVATTRRCSRGGVGPQIKFEQISSDHHQMSLARGGPRSDAQGWREGVPYRVTYLMQWWIDLRGVWGMCAPRVQILSISSSFGKIWQILCWHPSWRVGAPISGKSWIRHCHGAFDVTYPLPMWIEWLMDRHLWKHYLPATSFASG